MSFVNSYKAPSEPSILPESELYGPDPYDVNFVFPIHPDRLETERVKLTPFIPSIHAKASWEGISNSKDLFRYYPMEWPTFELFLTGIERSVRARNENILFAIIDKTRPDPAHSELGGGSLAGFIGLFHTSASNLSTEIAFVAIFAAFQRTHVSANAVGILMKYCLQTPTASPPGLGLRRVQWHSHTRNTASRRLAENMGMKFEGVIRWHWVLPEAYARDGMQASKDDPYPERPGRDTVVLSACWDDWENGAREMVQSRIDRRV